jgi:mono/diheme cytochrome c family protein
MQKTFIRIGVALLILVGFFIIAGVFLSISTNNRLNKTYAIESMPVEIPTDAASIEEGRRLAAIYCGGCHGPDFGGTDFVNDPALAVVDAPNLTSGNGGIGSYYSDQDWVRAIRHGVDSDGRALFIMPSKDFYYFSDEDLGQIIAYFKSTSPVDRDSSDFEMGVMGRILIGLGVMGDMLNAENIAHDTRPPSPPAGVSVEYGEYLVNTFGCRSCHGVDLAGGAGPEPGAPPGPNLTRGGNFGNLSDENFINFVRSMRSDFMPYESLAKMDDEELRAIWMHIQSLPAIETE